MYESNKRYNIVLSDGTSSVWREDHFNINKEKLYAKYPDATVTELTDMGADDDDISSDDSYEITVGKDTSTWDGDKYKENKNLLFTKYPDAKVTRSRLAQDIVDATPHTVEGAGRAIGTGQSRTQNILDSFNESVAETQQAISPEGMAETFNAGEAPHDPTVEVTDRDKGIAAAKSKERDIKRLDDRIASHKKALKDAKTDEDKETQKRNISELDAKREEAIRQFREDPYATHVRDWAKDEVVEGRESLNLAVETGQMAGVGPWYKAAEMFYDLADEALDTSIKYAPDQRSGVASILKGTMEGAVHTIDNLLLSKLDLKANKGEALQYVRSIMEQIEEKCGNLKEENLKHVNIEEILSPEDYQIWKAFEVYSTAIAEKDYDATISAKAGEVSGISLPFVVEMILTRNFGNAFGGTAKKILVDKVGQGLGRMRAAGYAANMTKTLGRKALERSVESAAKFSIATTEKLLTAMAMQAIAPSTKERIGDLLTQVNEQGHLMSNGDAAWDGYWDSVKETFTELSGEKYLSMLGDVMKVTGGASLISKYAKTPWGKFAKEWSKTAAAGKFASKTAFNGLGEIVEELEGAIIDRVIGGQDGAVKEFFKKENFATMILGFAPMTALGIVSSATEIGANKRALREVLSMSENNFMDNFSELNYTTDQWRSKFETLRNNMKNPEDLAMLLGQMVDEYSSTMDKNTKLTDEDRMNKVKAARDYANSLLDYYVINAQANEVRERQRDAMHDTWVNDHGGVDFVYGEGDNRVVTTAMFNGKRVFVKSGGVQSLNDDVEVSFITEDGKLGFAEKGELTDINGQTYEQYMDGLIDTENKRADEERVARETEERRDSVRRQLQVGLLLPNFGTKEMHRRGTVTAITPDGVQVQFDEETTVNGKTGKVLNLTIDEVGKGLAEPIDTRVMTAEQTEIARANIIGHGIALKTRLNQRFAGKTFAHNGKTYRWNGMYKSPMYTPEGEQVAIMATDEDGLLRRVMMPLKELDDQTPMDFVQEEVTQIADDGVQRDFRGNPLPLIQDAQGDTRVDQTTLWNNDPEAWTNWNDSKNNDGGKDSFSYVNYSAIPLLMNEIATLNQSLVGEIDFGKRDEMKRQILEKQMRLSDLQELSQKYVAKAIGEMNVEGLNVKVTNSTDVLADMVSMQCSQQEITDMAEGLRIARIPGVYSHSAQTVIIVADEVESLEEARETYIHESTHHKNNIDGFRERILQQTGLQGAELLNYVTTLSKTSFYTGKDDLYLADELIAHIAEQAYRNKDKSLREVLAMEGITNEKLINFVENIDNERAAANNLLATGNVAHDSEGDSTGDIGNGTTEDGGSAEVGEQRSGSPEGGEGPLNLSAKEFTIEGLPEDLISRLDSHGLTFDGGLVMSKEASELKRNTGYLTPAERNTDIDYLNFSGKTLPGWEKTYRTYPDYEERVILALQRLEERMSANELINGVIPQGDYEYGKKVSGSFAGPLRTSNEYVITFDLDTTCPRTFQYLNNVRKIEKQICRPLTQVECIQLLEMMRAYGQQIPCAYCYCENKRQAYKDYFTKYMDARYGVLSAATDEEALPLMYGQTGKGGDAKTALTPPAYEVFKEWRQNKDSLLNIKLKFLWHFYNQDRNCIITALDMMMDEGQIDAKTKDTELSKIVAKYFNVTDKKAMKAIDEIIEDWKLDVIENKEHVDFTPMDEDVLFIDQRVFNIWRDMTAYAKSASSAKLTLRYIPYTDELKKLSEEQRDYINGMGGVRMHSSNDFRPDYVFDYFQFMADLAATGMFGHTYTKSPNFVRIFGNSGYKINMSIAAYEDENGNITENDAEGMSWAIAKELREAFPNAGIMLMATSDNQIQMALDSDWIDMFIPFHSSSLPKAVWHDIRMWNDYTNSQNERFFNTNDKKKRLRDAGIAFPKNAKSSEISAIYEEHFPAKKIIGQTGKNKGKLLRPHFLPGETIVDGNKVPGHHNDVATYLRLCEEYGVHPRFEGIQVQYQGKMVDITEHPGYIKCIKETARTDSPQTAIQFNFDQYSDYLGKTPLEEAYDTLEAWAMSESGVAGKQVRSFYESTNVDVAGVIPDFIDNIIKHKEETGKNYPIDYLTEGAKKAWKLTKEILNDTYEGVGTVPYHRHDYDKDGNPIGEGLIKPIDLTEMKKAIDFVQGRISAEPMESVTGTQNASESALNFKVLSKEEEPRSYIPVYKMMRLGPDGLLYPLFVGRAQGMEVKRWVGAESPALKDIEKLDYGFHLVDLTTGEVMESRPLNIYKRKDKAGNLKTNKNGEPVLAYSNPITKGMIDIATVNNQRWMVVKPDAGLKGGGKLFANIGVSGGKESVAEYSLRPGWHATNMCANNQIKGSGYRDDSYVWCRCYMSADVDYQEEASRNPDGDIPTHIPEGGFYHFRTNSNANPYQEWFIGGALMVDKILSDDEADATIDEAKRNDPNNADKYTYDLSRKDGRRFYSDTMKVEDRRETPEQDTDSRAKKREELSFKIGKKRKATIASQIHNKLTSMSDEQITQTINEIERLGEMAKKGGDSKFESVLVDWVTRGLIILPQDNDRSILAYNYAKRFNVRTDEIDNLSQFLDAVMTKTAQKEADKNLIDPDTVPEFTNKTVLSEAHGVVVYDVPDSREGQRAVRTVVDSHFGKDANPWCLISRFNDGDTLDMAWSCWRNYSSAGRKIAFQNGRLIAFMSSASRNEEWWDRLDRSHRKVPIMVKFTSDGVKVTAQTKVSAKDADELEYDDLFSVSQNGVEESYDSLGQIVNTRYTKVKDGKKESVSISYTRMEGRLDYPIEQVRGEGFTSAAEVSYATTFSKDYLGDDGNSYTAYYEIDPVNGQPLLHNIFSKSLDEQVYYGRNLYAGNPDGITVDEEPFISNLVAQHRITEEDKADMLSTINKIINMQVKRPSNVLKYEEGDAIVGFDFVYKGRNTVGTLTFYLDPSDINRATIKVTEQMDAYNVTTPMGTLIINEKGEYVAGRKSVYEEYKPYLDRVPGIIERALNYTPRIIDNVHATKKVGSDEIKRAIADVNDKVLAPEKKTSRALNAVKKHVERASSALKRRIEKGEVTEVLSEKGEKVTNAWREYIRTNESNDRGLEYGDKMESIAREIHETMHDPYIEPGDGLIPYDVYMAVNADREFVAECPDVYEHIALTYVLNPDFWDIEEENGIGIINGIAQDVNDAELLSIAEEMRADYNDEINNVDDQMDRIERIYKNLGAKIKNSQSTPKYSEKVKNLIYSFIDLEEVGGQDITDYDEYRAARKSFINAAKEYTGKEYSIYDLFIAIYDVANNKELLMECPELALYLELYDVTLDSNDFWYRMDMRATDWLRGLNDRAYADPRLEVVANEHLTQDSNNENRERWTNILLDIRKDLLDKMTGSNSYQSLPEIKTRKEMREDVLIGLARGHSPEYERQNRARLQELMDTYPGEVDYINDRFYSEEEENGIIYPDKFIDEMKASDDMQVRALAHAYDCYAFAFIDNPFGSAAREFYEWAQNSNYSLLTNARGFYDAFNAYEDAIHSEALEICDDQQCYHELENAEDAAFNALEDFILHQCDVIEQQRKDKAKRTDAYEWKGSSTKYNELRAFYAKYHVLGEDINGAKEELKRIVDAYGIDEIDAENFTNEDANWDAIDQYLTKDPNKDNFVESLRIGQEIWELENDNYTIADALSEIDTIANYYHDDSLADLVRSKRELLGGFMDDEENFPDNVNERWSEFVDPFNNYAETLMKASINEARRKGKTDGSIDAHDIADWLLHGIENAIPCLRDQRLDQIVETYQTYHDSEEFINNMEDHVKDLESKPWEEASARRLAFSAKDISEMDEREAALRDALVGVMRDAGLDVVTDSEEGWRVLDEANGEIREQRVRHGRGASDHVRFFRTADGEAYGFTVGGKIYIDSKIATSETPIHEYAHLWSTVLQKGNPTEWKNVVSLMKGTSVWNEVKKRYPDLETDNEIADEVLAAYSGRRGAERLRAEHERIANGEGSAEEKAGAISVLQRVKEALDKFWKGVADFLNIRYTSAEEVADQVMKDLLDGVDPREFGTDENGDVKYSFRRRAFGGNSGYVGYSISRRGQQAKEEGRFPKTQFKKEYGITEASLNALIEAGIIDNSEWHHTSMYGNRTTFYGWNEDTFADIYRENKKEVDGIAKSLAQSAKLGSYIPGSDIFDDYRGKMTAEGRFKPMFTPEENAEYQRKQNEISQSGLPRDERITLHEALETERWKEFDARIKTYEESIRNSEEYKQFETEEMERRTAIDKRKEADKVAKARLGEIFSGQGKNENALSFKAAYRPQFSVKNPLRGIDTENAPQMISVINDVTRHGLAAITDNYDQTIFDIFNELSGKDRIPYARLFLSGGMRPAVLAESYAEAAGKENNTPEEEALIEAAGKVLSQKVGFPLTDRDTRYLLYNNVHHADEDVFQIAKNIEVIDRLGFSSGDIEMTKDKIESIERKKVNDLSFKVAQDYYNTSLGIRAAMQESYGDMYEAANRMVDAIEKSSGRNAEAFEDVRLAFNQLSSKNFADKDKYIRKYLEPMWDVLNGMLSLHQNDPITMDDITKYVVLKHGLERNEKFAQRDALNEYASARDAAITTADREFKAGNITDVERDQRKDDTKNIYLAHEAAVKAGTDSLFLEKRKTDYSGLMSWFYTDNSIPKRKRGESREAYNQRLMNSRVYWFDNLADAEKEADIFVKNFERHSQVNDNNEVERIGRKSGLKVNVGDNMTDILWDAINAATKETLRHQYEANMLTRGQYDSLKNMFDFYVPLRGFEDKDAESLYVYYNKEANNNFNSPILRAKGRKSRAENPFGFIASAAESAIQMDNKNMAKMALYNFVSNRENNGLAELSECWYEDTGMTGPDGKPIYEKHYPAITPGMTPDQISQAWDALEQQMLAKRAQGVKVYKGRNHLALNAGTIHINDKSIPEHFISVKVNGKDYDIIINGNPRAAQELNGNINVENTESDIVKFLMGWNRIKSALATSLNPDFFAVTNLMRDLTYSQVTALVDHGGKFWRKYNANIGKVMLNGRILRLAMNGTDLQSAIARHNPQLTQLYKEFVDNGGPTGFTVLTNNKDYDKKLEQYVRRQMGGKAAKAIGGFFAKAGDFAEAIEQVGRFSAYLTAKEMGMSIPEAVNAAKEITLNFNRKGSGQPVTFRDAQSFVTSDNPKVAAMQRVLIASLTAPAVLKVGTMFFNAQIQGLEKFGKLIKKAPATMAGVMAANMALGFLNAAMHGLWGGDDDDKEKDVRELDDYFNVPTFLRRTNYLIGTGDGKYVRIPIPQEFIPFYSIGDIMATEIFNHINPSGKPGEEIVDAFGELLPFNIFAGLHHKRGAGYGITDTFMRGIAFSSGPWSLLNNETFYGAPIHYDNKYVDEGVKKATARWTEHGNSKDPLFPLYIDISKGLNKLTGGDAVRAGSINIYPEDIKFVAQDFMGGAGRFWVRMGSLLTGAMKGQLSDIPTEDLPFINRVMTDTNSKYEDGFKKDAIRYFRYNLLPVMKEYETGYIEQYSESPEVMEKLDELQRKKDAVKGRTKAANAARKKIDAEKAKLLSVENAVPKEVYESKEFQTWLKVRDVINKANFTPNTELLVDARKLLKKETDPEKRKVISEQIRMMEEEFWNDLINFSMNYKKPNNND